MGAHVIVHDLKAQPEYNGLVGIVGETGSNERVAVTLLNRNSQQIIKLSLLDPIISIVWECSVEVEGTNQEFLNVYMD